ncbi:MAG: hypothetical protein L0099_11430 [Acidobacteria bacterium]|nr:hypothetical protein [Acidobacteriota bacterium]
MPQHNLPTLVRAHYVRENRLEILGGGGEQVLYRFPDGRTITNWDLIHSLEYDAFKQGFRDGFEGRAEAPEAFAEFVRCDYASGFRRGLEERGR